MDYTEATIDKLTSVVLDYNTTYAWRSDKDNVSKVPTDICYGYQKVLISFSNSVHVSGNAETLL